MGTFRLRKRSNISSWGWAAEMQSVSMRSTSTPGNCSSSSSCTRWVPKPMKFSCPPHSGQALGRGWEKPQWWHISRPLAE